MKEGVTDLFQHNDGDTFPQWKLTAYSLLNSVTDYVDHTRSTRGKNKETSRYESAVLGSGAVLKTKALELISTVAQSLPERTTTYSVGDVSRETPTQEATPDLNDLLDMWATNSPDSDSDSDVYADPHDGDTYAE
jgi:hypothetical protein